MKAMKQPMIPGEATNSNVEGSLHDTFKAATAAKGENMTDVLMQFIQRYVEEYGFEPKKKGQRCALYMRVSPLDLHPET